MISAKSDAAVIVNRSDMDTTGGTWHPFIDERQ